MDELIERLERATEPSHELDVAIAAWCHRNGGLCDVTYDPELWVIRNGGHTGSIDAALSLVPDGYGWQVGRPIQDYGATGYYATVFRERRKDEAGFWPGSWAHDGGPERGAPSASKLDRYAATPALALCIAALRARRAIQGGTDEANG